MTSVNLGCPYLCSEYDLCVDLNPINNSPQLLQMDVYEFLEKYPNRFNTINAKNLLEHIPNVGKFFELCYAALQPNGILTFETDNAEWPFFHINGFHWLMPKRTWIGVHSNKKFNREMNGSPHLALFTKMHLQHYADLYGFEALTIQRVKHGAHLWAVFQKPWISLSR